MMDDAELLRRYATENSESAFAELVARHIGFVYGAALRQLHGARHRADEVTQSVFIDLARKAMPLSRRTSLVGWLHTSTHFAAAKLKRTEERRERHEKEAHAMNELMVDSRAAEWERLRPVLDEAMLKLPDPDRESILMRYFQGHSFADVGRHLGRTEDAARMRVDRALEKLRGELARRDITSTAAALALTLAHQPVIAVPSALAASITTTVLSAGAVGGGSAVGLFFMSMSNAKIAGGLLGLAILGASLAGNAYQMRERRTLEEKIAALSRPPPPAANLPQPANPASAEPQTVREESQPLREFVGAAGGDAGDTVLAKVGRLRDMLARLPEQGIPELQLITEDDWYAAVDGSLETEGDYRLALSKLRGRAEKRFAVKAYVALRAFMDSHGGAFPMIVPQLKPFFEGAMDDAILLRYKIVPATEVRSLRMGGDRVITQLSLVDSAYDSRVAIGPNGHGTASQKTQTGAVLDRVIKAYTQANPGVAPNDPAHLLPFAKTPEERAALEEVMRQVRR